MDIDLKTCSKGQTLLLRYGDVATYHSVDLLIPSKTHAIKTANGSIIFLNDEGKWSHAEESMWDVVKIMPMVKASQEEPVIELALCETEYVGFRPNCLYRFIVRENCTRCAELAKGYS